MSKQNIFRFGFWMLVLSVLCVSVPVSAKKKGMNYKKELPKCFQVAIEEQQIDVDGDGRLSQKEINAVEALTLVEETASQKYYSLKKIVIFKNLKYLTVNCHVKNLKPLYSLKKLKSIEIVYWEGVRNKNVDFSKLKKLQSLNAPSSIGNGKIDLRKNNKLNTVIIRGSQARVYLQDREYDFGELEKPELKVYFCKGTKKRKAEFFYQRIPAKDKFGNVIEDEYKCAQLHVAKDRTYTIKELALVSVTSEKAIKSVLNGKNIKWKCTSKNIKISNGKFMFTKTGVYTLVGFGKNKCYVFSVYVENKNINVAAENVARIRIYSNQKTVAVTDKQIISEICSLLNACNYQFDDVMMVEQPKYGGVYSVKFEREDGEEIADFRVVEDVISRYSIWYRKSNEGTTSFAEYIRNIHEKGQS